MIKSAPMRSLTTALGCVSMSTEVVANRESHRPCPASPNRGSIQCRSCRARREFAATKYCDRPLNLPMYGVWHQRSTVPVITIPTTNLKAFSQGRATPGQAFAQTTRSGLLHPPQPFQSLQWKDFPLELASRRAHPPVYLAAIDDSVEFFYCETSASPSDSFLGSHATTVESCRKIIAAARTPPSA